MRTWLATLVPEPMVPAAIMLIDTVPMTANGKVDVAALPPPSFDGETAPVQPSGPVEEVLCQLWAEVLGVDAVGAEDDFFAHGGHSLLATRLATRIRDSLRVNLALRTLFENPTPRAIAAELRAGDDAARRSTRSPRSCSRCSPSPTTTSPTRSPHEAAQEAG